MSYDIWLEADLVGSERTQVGDLDWNYTSNVSAMWRKAMPETDGLGDMDGMECKLAAEHLASGIASMESDDVSYRALDPANGWGDFDSQLTALRKLLMACRESPDAIVVVSP